MSKTAEESEINNVDGMGSPEQSDHETTYSASDVESIYIGKTDSLRSSRSLSIFFDPSASHDMQRTEEMTYCMYEDQSLRRAQEMTSSAAAKSNRKSNKSFSKIGEKKKSKANSRLSGIFQMKSTQAAVASSASASGTIRDEEFKKHLANTLAQKPQQASPPVDLQTNVTTEARTMSSVTSSSSALKNEDFKKHLALTLMGKSSTFSTEAADTDNKNDVDKPVPSSSLTDEVFKSLERRFAQQTESNETESEKENSPPKLEMEKYMISKAQLEANSKKEILSERGNVSITTSAVKEDVKTSGNKIAGSEEVGQNKVVVGNSMQKYTPTEVKAKNLAIHDEAFKANLIAIFGGRGTEKGSRDDEKEGKVGKWAVVSTESDVPRAREVIDLNQKQTVERSEEYLKVERVEGSGSANKLSVKQLAEELFRDKLLTGRSMIQSPPAVSQITSPPPLIVENTKTKIAIHDLQKLESDVTDDSGIGSTAELQDHVRDDGLQELIQDAELESHAQDASSSDIDKPVTDEFPIYSKIVKFRKTNISEEIDSRIENEDQLKAETSEEVSSTRTEIQKQDEMRESDCNSEVILRSPVTAVDYSASSRTLLKNSERSRANHEVHQARGNTRAALSESFEIDESNRSSSNCDEKDLTTTEIKSTALLTSEVVTSEKVSSNQSSKSHETNHVINDVIVPKTRSHKSKLIVSEDIWRLDEDDLNNNENRSRSISRELEEEDQRIVQEPRSNSHSLSRFESQDDSLLDESPEIITENEYSSVIELNSDCEISYVRPSTGARSQRKRTSGSGEPVSAEEKCITRISIDSYLPPTSGAFQKNISEDDDVRIEYMTGNALPFRSNRSKVVAMNRSSGSNYKDSKRRIRSHRQSQLDSEVSMSDFEDNRRSRFQKQRRRSRRFISNVTLAPSDSEFDTVYHSEPEYVGGSEDRKSSRLARSNSSASTAVIGRVLSPLGFAPTSPNSIPIQGVIRLKATPSNHSAPPRDGDAVFGVIRSQTPQDSKFRPRSPMTIINIDNFVDDDDYDDDDDDAIVGVNPRLRNARKVKDKYQITMNLRPSVSRPSSRQDYGRPSSSQNYDRPLSRQEFDRPRSRQEYDRPPSRQNYDRPPSRQNYDRPPSRQNYDRPLSRQNYDRPPSRQNYDRPPSRQNYDRPPSRQNYDRPLSRQNYDRPSSRQNYDRPPSRHNYDRPPSRQNYESGFPPLGHSRTESGFFSDDDGGRSHQMAHTSGVGRRHDLRRQEEILRQNSDFGNTAVNNYGFPGDRRYESRDAAPLRKTRSGNDDVMPQFVRGVNDVMPQFVTGNILIKNSIDTTGAPRIVDVVEDDDVIVDDVIQEQTNMFHGQYTLRKENPLYSSDPDLLSKPDEDNDVRGNPVKIPQTNQRGVHQKLMKSVSIVLTSSDDEDHVDGPKGGAHASNSRGICHNKYIGKSANKVACLVGWNRAHV